MLHKIRTILWRILGVDYKQALRIHNYVFLKNDPYTTKGIGTYDNEALVFRWTKAPLSIGKYCSIANNVRFIIDEAFHNNSKITAYPLVNNLIKDDTSKANFSFKQKEGISIGNDVWIGMNALIMPGVTVGNGVTIAANSVVTKDIPDYCVAAGIPAKIIKHKHSDHQINALNTIAWWDWEQSKIKTEINAFYELDTDAFISKYSKS